jgi:hypothetical protein
MTGPLLTKKRIQDWSREGLLEEKEIWPPQLATYSNPWTMQCFRLY